MVPSRGGQASRPASPKLQRGECFSLGSSDATWNHYNTLFQRGAAGGGRTLMSLRPQDFESCASANSATAAITLNYLKILYLAHFLRIFLFFLLLYNLYNFLPRLIHREYLAL